MENKDDLANIKAQVHRSAHNEDSSHLPRVEIRGENCEDQENRVKNFHRVTANGGGGVVRFR